jgi:hypothetical protein
MPRCRTVVRVIAVTLNDGPMDCEDDETAHVWVRVIAWSPRRAFLTGASPFARAAGKEPADLAGLRFFASLDLYDPPSNDYTSGERLEWPGLSLCPPVDVARFLGPRRVDGAPSGGDA